MESKEKVDIQNVSIKEIKAFIKKYRTLELDKKSGDFYNNQTIINHTHVDSKNYEIYKRNNSNNARFRRSSSSDDDDDDQKPNFFPRSNFRNSAPKRENDSENEEDYKTLFDDSPVPFTQSPTKDHYMLNSEFETLRKDHLAALHAHKADHDKLLNETKKIALARDELAQIYKDNLARDNQLGENISRIVYERIDTITSAITPILAKAHDDTFNIVKTLEKTIDEKFLSLKLKEESIDSILNNEYQMTRQAREQMMTQTSKNTLALADQQKALVEMINNIKKGNLSEEKVQNIIDAYAKKVEEQVASIKQEKMNQTIPIPLTTVAAPDIVNLELDNATKNTLRQILIKLETVDNLSLQQSALMGKVGEITQNINTINDNVKIINGNFIKLKGYASQDKDEIIATINKKGPPPPPPGANAELIKGITSSLDEKISAADAIKINAFENKLNVQKQEILKQLELVNNSLKEAPKAGTLSALNTVLESVKSSVSAVQNTLTDIRSLAQSPMITKDQIQNIISKIDTLNADTIPNAYTALSTKFDINSSVINENIQTIRSHTLTRAEHQSLLDELRSVVEPYNTNIQALENNVNSMGLFMNDVMPKTTINLENIVLQNQKASLIKLESMYQQMANTIEELNQSAKSMKALKKAEVESEATRLRINLDAAARAMDAIRHSRVIELTNLHPNMYQTAITHNNSIVAQLVNEMHVLINETFDQELLNDSNPTLNQERLQRLHIMVNTWNNMLDTNNVDDFTDEQMAWTVDKYFEFSTLVEVMEQKLEYLQSPESVLPAMLTMIKIKDSENYFHMEEMKYNQDRKKRELNVTNIPAAQPVDYNANGQIKMETIADRKAQKIYTPVTDKITGQAENPRIITQEAASFNYDTLGTLNENQIDPEIAQTNYRNLTSRLRTIFENLPTYLDQVEKYEEELDSIESEFRANNIYSQNQAKGEAMRNYIGMTKKMIIEQKKMIRIRNETTNFKQEPEFKNRDTPETGETANNKDTVNADDMLIAGPLTDTPDYTATNSEIKNVNINMAVQKNRYIAPADRGIRSQETKVLPNRIQELKEYEALSANKKKQYDRAMTRFRSEPNAHELALQAVDTSDTGLRIKKNNRYKQTSSQVSAPSGDTTYENRQNSVIRADSTQGMDEEIKDEPMDVQPKIETNVQPKVEPKIGKSTKQASRPVYKPPKGSGIKNTVLTAIEHKNNIANHENKNAKLGENLKKIYEKRKESVGIRESTNSRDLVDNMKTLPKIKGSGISKGKKMICELCGKGRESDKTFHMTKDKEILHKKCFEGKGMTRKRKIIEVARGEDMDETNPKYKKHFEDDDRHNFYEKLKNEKFDTVHEDFEKSVKGGGINLPKGLLNQASKHYIAYGTCSSHMIDIFTYLIAHILNNDMEPNELLKLNLNAMRLKILSTHQFKKKNNTLELDSSNFKNLKNSLLSSKAVLQDLIF